MTNLVPYTPLRRKARWWFVVTVVLVGIAAVRWGIGSWRIRAWENDVASRNCMPPFPRYPDTAALGWVGVALVGTAMVCLITALVLVVIDRHRWWMKVSAALLIAVVLLLASWLVAIVFLAIDRAVDSPTSPCKWLIG